MVASAGGKKKGGKGQPLLRGGGSYDPSAMHGGSRAARDAENGLLAFSRAGAVQGDSAKVHREASFLVAQTMATQAAPVDVLETLSAMVEHDPKAAARLAGLLGAVDAKCAARTSAADRLAAAIRLDASAGALAGAAHGAVHGAVPVPSYLELRLVALEAMVPFIGFGFIDNFLMLVAGDYIDLKMCVTFGFSTMFAAGLGNLISDVAGVGLGGVVERLAEKMGLPTAQLTRAQMKLRITRYAHHSGCALGVALGCLIGMVPLLFLDTNKALDLRLALAESEEPGIEEQR
jgi:hypothetical protein